MLLARIDGSQLSGFAPIFMAGLVSLPIFLAYVMPALTRRGRKRAVSQLGQLWAEYPLAEPVISFGLFTKPSNQERWRRWKGRFLLGYFILGSVGVVLADAWQERLNMVIWGWLMASMFLLHWPPISTNRLMGPFLVGQNGWVHADGFAPWSHLREVRVDSSPGSTPEAPTRVVLITGRQRGEVWLANRDAQALAHLVAERVSPTLCPGALHAQAG